MVKQKELKGSELYIHTEKQLSKLKHKIDGVDCCMCGDKISKNIMTLGEMVDTLDKEDDSYGQALILLESGFERKDKFCEECFWK
jgi:hypothetical protein